MKKGQKMSEEQKNKIINSNKITYKKKGPYFQAFGKDNPACNDEVKKKISNTVKALWEEGKYNNRINGMKGKKGLLNPNFNPVLNRKNLYNNYLSQFQSIKKCSRCGKENQKIDVHHIDENRDNWLITNLEPLCINCHKKFHLNCFVQPYVVIGRTFDMECCHQLHFYNGKCQRMHGHSYFFEIKLKKRIDPDTGMVMDFGKLKKIVNEFIIENLDHFNLNEKMPFQTTAENMIFWMWKQLEEKALLKGLYEIKLNETKNSQVCLNYKFVLEYEKKLLYLTKKDLKNEPN